MNPANQTRTLTNTENYLFAVGTYKLLAFTIGTICALGFCNNVLVLVLYYKFKRLRTPTNLLLVNISISDLLMCVIGINFTFISCIKRRWVWNSATCVWDGFSNSLFGIVSIMTLAALAYERYIRVVHAKVVDFPWAWRAITHIWLYSIAWTGAPLLGWNRYTLEIHQLGCSLDWASKDPNDASFILLFLLGCFFVPVGIMAYCYGNILYTVRMEVSRRYIHSAATAACGGVCHRLPRIPKELHSGLQLTALSHHLSTSIQPTPAGNRSDQEAGSLIVCTQTVCPSCQNTAYFQRREQEMGHGLLRSIQDLQTVQIIKILRYEKKVAVMFLLMISCFLVCWTPYAVVSMMEAFGRKSVVSPTLAIIPSFFAKSSTAYNPVIYIFMSRKFRRCLCQLLCSRLVRLQHSIKERPLASEERPIRPIVISHSRPNRPKKRVTFSSSSIVFIITSNDAQPLDVQSKCDSTTEVNVIQVRPL
ncbi:hypothetical protein AALO_G00233250 [Alosa alosa]|uniref:G-protein coupled receptors family 1 profile domain-containing protein n=1 Tax=Alosa alosa TaxID=278164 RepID=A0AAV6FXM6_9TELE|nr:hypothetical protein AALO_G00233250 [Alosa alosa]